jgi:SPP1 family predicted phage head-tail adaptor
MNIGFLDRRITVQVQSTATRNAFGEVPPSAAYTDVATVWAALDNKSATNIEIAEQETTMNRVTWRVRSSSVTRLVTPKYRIKYGDDYYNILAVQEVGRKNELHFISERVISE